MTTTKTISYSDPSWALIGGGILDETTANLERSIYGNGYSVRFGILESGRYVMDQTRLGREFVGSDAVVVYRAKVTAEFLEQLGPGCRVFARQGVGVDTLDLKAIREYGAFAFNVPDYCVDETSTHTLALMLSIERDICRQDQLIRNGDWSIRAGRMPVRLGEATLGIIGFGRIGRAVARKASPFFGRVLAYDPNVHGDLMVGYGALGMEELEELVELADVVSLHASLTSSSERLVRSGILEHFKPGALLINTARGALIDSGDVLQALEDGRLGGYATDVYSPENPHDTAGTSALAAHSRVVSTCHRAFLSSTADVSVRRRVAEQIREVLDTGRPPADGRLV